MSKNFHWSFASCLSWRISNTKSSRECLEYGGGGGSFSACWSSYEACGSIAPEKGENVNSSAQEVQAIPSPQAQSSAADRTRNDIENVRVFFSLQIGHHKRLFIHVAICVDTGCMGPGKLLTALRSFVDTSPISPFASCILLRRGIRGPERTQKDTPLDGTIRANCLILANRLRVLGRQKVGYGMVVDGFAKFQALNFGISGPEIS